MKEGMTNDFIDKYLERGFGSMTKNDFEVAIFHELLQRDNYKDASNYEMSIKLRIPEAKVVRLRYEESLKYLPSTEKEQDEFYLKKLSSALERVRLYKDKSSIVLSIEDKSARLFLKSLLKKDKRIMDSSFNSELVILRSDDYVYLLKQIDDKIGEKKLKDYKIDKLKDSVVEMIKSLTNESVSNLADFGINKIVDYVNDKG